jgi:beta-N-acetylhexosaminidase
MIAAQPPINHDPIPFGAKRKAEMRAYARRHYGLDTALLKNPKVIVEHVTVSTTFSAAFNTFAADVPDQELHELPGTCAHFIVDRAGKIHQLVSLRYMCRHTVGLNYTAIGIEHVGMSDAQVLGDARQMRASLRLTRWLQAKFGITTRNVIGHAESLSSPYHRERVKRLRRQTHGDWTHADMRVYRSRLSHTS